MTDILLTAIYLKLSDDMRELSHVTYKEIFNLAFTNDNKDKYLQELLPEKYQAIIHGVIDKKTKICINSDREEKLLRVIKIATSDKYINYHVVRSSEFKKDIYFSLGKINEFNEIHSNNYMFKKSDKVYNYISSYFPRGINLSDVDFKDISDDVRSEFYISNNSVKNSPMYNKIVDESNKKYLELSVYWGTNRLPRQYEKGLYFDNKRNNINQEKNELTVGHSLVTVPNNHKNGKIEKKKKWWGFWRDKKEDVNNYIIIHHNKAMENNDWVDSIRNEKDNSEGVLFIHGYNCSFDDGIYRSAQLKYDLNFSGPMFCFSWASAAKVISYTEDEATIDWSARHLGEFLDLIKLNVNLSKLHIIAHSMGSRALVSVIDTLSRNIGCVHTIVFAAPDVDAGKMMQFSKEFSVFNNVTLYSSSHDKAVWASSVVHQYPRAGNSIPPFVMKHVDTIDVSAIEYPIFSLGHGYFSETWRVFTDLYYLIKEGIPVNKRIGLRYNRNWGCFILT